MGSLIGHILPGTFFFLFGTWWCYSILQRFYLSRKEAILSSRGKRRGYRYKSTLLFPCCGCGQRWPMEAILIVAMTSVGIVGELVTAFKDGKFVHIGNLQHMTMYFFFGLMATVDIMMSCRVPLPPGLNYATALLALLVEGLLFVYHLHGRTSMDVQIHMFLVYLIAGAIVVGALEMKNRGNVLPAIGRAYFIVLQGTWFYHVGFILYPPSFMSHWDEEDHNQMMIVTVIFAGHLAAVFLFFCFIGIFVHCRTERMSRSNMYRALGMKVDGSYHVGMNGMLLQRGSGEAVRADGEEVNCNMTEGSDEDDV